MPRLSCHSRVTVESVTVYSLELISRFKKERVLENFKSKFKFGSFSWQTEGNRKSQFAPVNRNGR